MSESSEPNYSPIDDAIPPEELSEELQGMANRLKAALEELFAAKAEAEQMSASTSLPGEVESSLAVARAEIANRSHGEATAQDRRLYVPHSHNWRAGIQSGAREYCSIRQPGQDWFHLLVNGEIYLQFGTDKMCLNCALRQGYITEDRLYWQTGSGKRGMANHES